MQTKLFETFVLILSLMLLSVQVASAQDIEPVPPKSAQQLLKALIPSKKKFVAVNTYVAGTNVQDIDVGQVCSWSDGSGGCRDRHIIKRTMFLGFADVADSNAGYLVTVQCVEKMVWDHCDMPPEHTVYPVVIKAGKHGTFDVYAATAAQKLGGKMKVAKFAVLDISHVTKMQPTAQGAPHPKQ